jgi:hypothetical protein
MWRGIAAMWALGLSSLCSASEIGDFAGTWVFDKAHSSNVDAAVDTCVSKLNFVARSIAGPRLRNTNVPYDRIVIAAQPGQVKVVYGAAGSPISTSIDGKVVPWTREDGEVFQTSHELKGEKLIEVFRGEEGQKSTDLSVSADHAVLSLDVTVSSPRLPEPLVYKLVYRKKG